MKLKSLSECSYIGILKMIWVRHLITVWDDISGQAKVMGKREYLPITVNRNRLREDGRGPLKSTLNLSKNTVAFIRGRASG